MSQEEASILDQWLADVSFTNWAKRIPGADFEYWETWLAAHPEKRETAAIGRQVVLGLPFRHIETNPAEDRQQLQLLWQKIRREEEAIAPLAAKAPRRLYQRWPLQLAAALALLIGTVTAFMYLQSLSTITIETGYSEKKELILPDGSEVTLNANSRITYHMDQPREVWLSGEAYFKVVKMPETQTQFHVRTDELVVEVLGTSFNVKSRNDRTTVFLDEGKVRLNLNKKPQPEDDLLMDPGELISYSAMNSWDLVRKKSESQQHTSWKDGVMLLESQPLHVVLQEIEAIYGIQVDLRSDSMRDHILTIALPIEQMEIGLQTLEHGLGLKITRVDHKHYYFE